MSKSLPKPLRVWFWFQALLLLALVAPAWADPPTRVLRVTEVGGEAWWFDPDQREWQPLMRNQSLAEGDRVRVDAQGRVGLRVGASSLWLSESSQFEILRFDDERMDLALDQGALAVRWVGAEAAREAQVRTRDGRFLFEQPGAYRIDQLGRGSRAQAFEGRMRFEGRGSADAPVWLDAPEQAELWWDGGPRAERSRLLRHDAFGQWLVSELGFGRGERESERVAYRYVSPDLTGADELDRHGRWESSTEYGSVWIPLRVEVGWAPYRYGRWHWSRHWGWTWVDDLPWGYATSHYGRWVYWRNRWCWSPGHRVPRPVFAPALVAWVGSGNVSVGVSLGSRWAPPVAWVPLAPREVYVPWYRHSPDYWRRFNPGVEHRPHRPHEPVVPIHRHVPGAVSAFDERPEGRGRGEGLGRPIAVRDEQVVRELAPLQHGPAHGGPMPQRPAQSADEWQRPQNPGRWSRDPRDGNEARDSRLGREGRDPVAPTVPRVPLPGGRRDDDGTERERPTVRPAPRPEVRSDPREARGDFVRPDPRLEDTRPDMRRDARPETPRVEPRFEAQPLPLPQRSRVDEPLAPAPNSSPAPLWGGSARERAERNEQRPEQRLERTERQDRFERPERDMDRPRSAPEPRFEAPRSEPRRVDGPTRMDPPRVERPETRREAPERKEKDKEREDKRRERER
ncbi:DUF6600 domain-containing protein [Inhella gelatinilytica]|uniref:FecR family protein n=1 Tax=Inhella gelatinilytica TaxID=2795030 RepID=A0A931NDE5_9BURK|nr:DUF6600 domain-containing protein [Inhella gelatinilytica]MBH9552514.1 hypothetical protein [Inhella gelatinilytica]